jgi:Carboxypeptidase regulatory-like domain/TonB dependent receptor
MFTGRSISTSIFIFCAAATLTVFGQAFTASLSGTVNDPNGASIPGATVRVQNLSTNEVRQIITGPEGHYTVSQLPPGGYQVTVEAKGFKSFVQKSLTLRANQAAEFNIPMQVGDITQTVEVAAGIVLLDTQSANQGVTLNSSQLESLPASMRTPFAFLNAMAGTTSVSSLGSSVFNDVFDQQYSRFALNGGRDNTTLIMLDGAPATAVDWGGLMISPSIDSVQEMQVNRNTYDAEFGKTSGGVVSLVTKGGGNTFHGTAFDFFRNDNLDANSWSNNRAGRSKTEFKRNQFGGNLSGPIWKSKNLFFFGGYEGMRQRTPGSSGFLTVPTDLERSGDFSQSLNPDGSLSVIYNPFTTRPNPNGSGFVRDAFPGNRVPQNLFDPVAVKALALFPKPNLAGDPGTHTRNFYQTAPGLVVNDKIDSRIDWAHSAKHSMYARLSVAPRQNNVGAQYFGNGADSNKSDINPRFHGTWGNTFIPTPTWVVNVLLGASRWREGQLSPSLGHTGAELGLPASTVSQFQAATFPSFNFGGYSTLANSAQREFIRYTHNLQVNVSKERRLHSFKFGFMGELMLINNLDRRSADFFFSRGMTSGPTAATNSSTSGNAIASMLLGTGDNGNAPLRPDLAASMRTYAGYFQDNWRVTRRLTLNLGLRYELQRPATERFNRLSYFIPEATNPLAARTGLTLKGAVGFVNADDRGIWNQDTHDFAPRIGLAFKLTDKLVMRAGYGIFYANASSMFTFDPVPGFSSDTPWIASQGGGGLIPAAPLSNPFPGGLVQPVGSSTGALTQVGFNPNQTWVRNPHPTGYRQNYSLDFQYEISRSTVIEVGYAGFSGRRLMFGQPRESDQLPPQFLALGDRLNEQVTNPFFGIITDTRSVLSGPTVPRHRLLRPYPQFTSVSLTRSTPGADANFNALEVKVSKQFSNGLTLLSSYQWSKNIDNASEDIGWITGDAWRNFYDLTLDRSISSHDIPQSFVTNLVYELPVGKGKNFGASLPKAAESVIGGWQVSTIVRMSSGYPLPVGMPNSLGTYGYQTLRPNLISSNLTPANRTPDNWFNTAAFAAPPPFTIGNAPRYIGNLRTDWARNVDFGLMKYFRITEHVRTQFRGDFFNLFNTPQFGALGTTFSTGNFGKATGTMNAPRNVQLGLKLEF